jgi:small subunit ribosomal protein S13
MAEEVKQEAKPIIAQPVKPAQPEIKIAAQPAQAPKAESAVEYSDLIRIADKDVKGDVSVYMALTHVKGCDFMMANAVCNVLNLDKTAKCGYMTREQVLKIEDVMKHPDKYGIPVWMFNHRKDLDTGADKHLIAVDLTLQQGMDIRFLKKIRVYRGIRHSRGSKKVRGQHTRSTGRKGRTLGVIRKKEMPKVAPKKEAGKK